jgi:SHS2 domain-containing protein
MKDFELKEREDGIIVRGYGKSWEEVFENGAKALFSIITDIADIEIQEETVVKVFASDIESLFVDWLNELLNVKETKNLILSKFEVEDIFKEGEYQLFAKVWGGKAEVEKKIKSASFSELKRGKTKNGKFIQCLVYLC